MIINEADIYKKKTLYPQWVIYIYSIRNPLSVGHRGRLTVNTLIQANLSR